MEDLVGGLFGGLYSLMECSLSRAFGVFWKPQKGCILNYWALQKMQLNFFEPAIADPIGTSLRDQLRYRSVL